MDKGRTILIIDDEEIMRVAARAILEEHGLTVLEAADGETGLSRALEELPDLVLCDIEMPGKNGFDVLQLFRQNPSTNVVPFIFLTGRSERSVVRKGMDLGADDFLTKPFTGDELVATVKTRLEKKERAQNEATGRLDQLRKNISSSVPHELRTPLTGILGFGAVLKDQASTLTGDDIRQIADHILGSGQRLQNTLEKFWKYSEYAFLSHDEASRQALRSEVMDRPGAAIRVIAHEVAQKYKRVGDLKFELQSHCIRIHHEHLMPLVYEIVDNAFRFSANGSEVMVRCIADSKDEYATIEVRDQGRGMTREEVSAIGGFMQFGRQRLEQQGLGLGFSIARELAHLYGGELSVASGQEKGTTVSIRLPRCPS